MSVSGGRDDVIVVGAGVIGIACAHYLSQAGLRVTVLEQGSVAGACSHGNCGYVCPSHIPPLTEPSALRTALKSLFNPRSPFRVKPSLDPALWTWMWEFARRCNHRQVVKAGRYLQAILDASMSEYRRLMADERMDCEWRDAGLLYVFQTLHGLDAFAETDRMLTENFGLAANRIDGDQLPDFDSAIRPGLAGAFHYPGDASLRPDRLNQEWTKRLVKRGVQFVENCEVQRIEKTGRRVDSLRTSAEVYEADHYVFAMGAWSSRWSKALECSVPIQPGKGYSVTMPRSEPMPRHPILFPEHKVGVSPFENGLRLGSMMEFTGYDTSIPDHRIQQLRDSARPYLRAPLDGPAEERWYGWRPMTWDSLPIIGPTPNLQNAYLATGHNMLGLSMAPATGRLIAELITGTAPHLDPAPYAPSRFERGAGALGVG